MTEKTSQRKVVGKTVAIVLGVICIVLSAGLVAVLAVYLPAANSISNLNSQVAAQNATITSQQQQIAALQRILSQPTNNQDAQIADLNARIADLNDYSQNLMSLLFLNASGILVQNQPVSLQANENVSIWNDVVEYAGYIVVQAQSSSNTTFANVVYTTSYGVNYDEVVLVGTDGAAAFPVLPGLIDVRIGNTETSSTVSATVTARYHY